MTVHMITSDLHKVVEILQNGGVAIFPTDTVWGIGCAANRPDGIEKLYRIKKREANKPTAILVGSKEQALLYGKFTESAEVLADQHWPGALTIIVPASFHTPESIQGETKTVGIRYPNFPTVQQVCSLVGCGLVTSSANFAGMNPPNQIELIDQRLISLVDVMVQGECGNQPPSTVVDATSDELKILRQGSVEISNS